VLRPPILTGVVGLLTNSIFLLQVFVDKAIAITRNARGTDFNDLSVGIFTLHGNNFRCQFVYQTFIQASLMHTHACQYISILFNAYQCSSKHINAFQCLPMLITTNIGDFQCFSMIIKRRLSHTYQCL
jgi:hypothetical protein